MANVTQLGYLGLSVSDVDAWKRFATETLGLQVNGWEADGAVLLRMDEHYHRLIVHPTGRTTWHTSAGKSPMSRCSRR